MEEEEENSTTATSMFGIICAVYGKDTALEIVNAMLNNMHMTAALGYVITEYRKGTAGVCVLRVAKVPRTDAQVSQTHRNLYFWERSSDRSRTYYDFYDAPLL